MHNFNQSTRTKGPSKSDEADVAARRAAREQRARMPALDRKKRPELRDLIKKIPKLRGRGVNINRPMTDAKLAVNLSSIEAAFSAGDSFRRKLS